MTPEQVLQIIEADSEHFRPAGATLLEDGYPSTGHVENLMVGSFTLVPNPVPAAQVPKPFTFDEAVDCIATSLETMSDQVFSEFEAAVNNGTLRSWQRVAKARGKITAGEQTALVALLDRTISDPAWVAEIPATPKVAATDCIGLGDLINQALGRKRDADK